MNLPKETEEKIAQLQLIEQNMQKFLMQKQNFQAQELEIDNALLELDRLKGQAYKITGGIMIATEKDDLKKDLNSKKEIIELRLKSIKKQEDSLREKAETLQADVMKNMPKQ